MDIFVKIEAGRYMDSLETLYASSILAEQPGVDSGYVGVAADSFKDTLRSEGLYSQKLDMATGNDFVIVARCEDMAVFEAAVGAVYASFDAEEPDQAEEEHFVSTRAAVLKHPEANLCSIAVPGENALGEVKKALNAGLHCVARTTSIPIGISCLPRSRIS